MYKVASRNLQHRHAVDRPLATGGYIGTVSAVEQDYIPTADNLSREECLSERRQLILEKTRAENELAGAKIARDQRRIEAVGGTIQGYCLRLSAIRTRLTALNDERRCELLSEAVKEVCDEETRNRVFARFDEMWASRGGKYG